MIGYLASTLLNCVTNLLISNKYLKANNNTFNKNIINNLAVVHIK